MRQSKKFEHMNVWIEVVLTNTVPEGFHVDAEAGVFDFPRIVKGNYVFTIWFKECISTRTLCHECWHLFMNIMSVLDSHGHSFMELKSELYAYTFHALCVKVEEAATGMKMYEEFWQKRLKENGKKILNSQKKKKDRIT